MNSKDHAPDNGLSLSVSKGTEKLTDALPSWAAGGALAAGIALVLRSFASSLKGEGIIYGIAAALAAILIMALRHTRAKRYVFPAALILVPLLFFGAFRSSIGGTLSLGNDLLSFLNGKTGRFHMPFDLPENTGAGDVIYSFLIILLVVGIISAFAAERRRLLLPSAALLLSLFGTFYGLFSSIAGLILIAVSILMLALVRDRTGRVTSGNRAAAYLVVLACLLAESLMGTALAGAFWPGNSKTIVDPAEELIHKSRYDSGTKELPEGDLKDLGPRYKGSEEAVSVTMEKPEKLYLRGHVYESYTGLSWEKADDAVLRDGADMFYWLHKEGFFGQDLIGNAYRLTGSEDIGQIEIKNISACKEVDLLPYGLSPDYYNDNKALFIGDAGTKASGSSYTAEVYEGTIMDWYMLQDSLAGIQDRDDVKRYLDMEASYREYVEANDLQLTNAALGVLGRIIGDDDGPRTLSSIFGIIRDTLSDTISYSDGVTTYNGNSDFLQYVLEQSRSGYDVHYATAAVLMFRYMGVPARYVEGYYISPEEASQMNAGEEYILDGSNAHAWAEYYLDGVGWLPFETTPGYDQSEEAEVASLGEGLSGSLNKSSYTSTQQRYEPPEDPEEEDTNENSERFRFTTAFLIKAFLILFLVLLLLFIIRTILRYVRYRNAMNDIRSSDNRNAIIKSYAYADMLSKLATPVSAAGSETAREINLEAMYSKHEMDDEKRKTVTDYAARIREERLKSFTFLQKIRYHFAGWIC